MDRIGFIGLGQMGWPMARRLAEAGYSLTVADAAPGVADRFAAEFKTSATADMAVLAKASDVVITMLPDGKIVRKVVLDAVAPALAKGSVVLDMSSSAPIGTRELGEDLVKLGLALVDAPVSGGVPRAKDGTLAIMIGGEDKAAIARCRPLLEKMGQSLFETGPLGSGHAMKALNNYVSAAGLIASIEALQIGARFGLSPDAMVDVLNASTGRNNSTEKKLKQYVLSRQFNSGFGLGLMEKDLRTALDLAHQTGIQAPFGDACVELWQKAYADLGAGADHTAVAQLWEKLNNLELTPAAKKQAAE
ncbi:MAG: NAD(P)-dependent oxidoreductase [Alphaproteobacteria bacterium]|nr:NAD(P)-dependent oxidoreductase [Alphaproteobacteria bacterium]MBU0888274.1 NAD(P)-dependent oxidoreductase [Alphaproteobacteria bacterium]MBU1811475.1 NAD(P)-dependent oxidoreductase [Alphaproteobacteria bacterium]